MRWHWVIATLFVPILAALFALTFGQRAGAFVMLIWPLWLAWRFDNKSGTFLMLAILIYIVFLVIALLLAGLVAIATYGSVSQ
ncbi:hypothetical protein MNBD_ALPHA04-1153 [hydrothermal vent metagenome]|uniref:Uncharacterized protein n=1 Tax=hydrothermal vent metagenome TaxID=652676 RepID=A0A3B0SD44_9ZZZZ